MSMTFRPAAPAAEGLFTLQIIHVSDQEAGAGQINDILGMSAVMEFLSGLGFENTLRLTSGDTFIPSPFSNASQDTAVFFNPDSRDGSAIPGIADILIQNALGWDAAAIGNHEFGFGPGTLAQLVGDGITVNFPDDIGGEDIFPGALFPFLSLNLDFSTQPDMARFAVEGPIEIDADATNGNEGANSFSSSVIIDRGGERIGVLAAVTPYLRDIANIGTLEVTTRLEDGSPITNRTPAAVQAARLVTEIAPLVADLEARGINKIVLMTHLQEAPIEQELARQLAEAGINVDVLMGGGSHQAMSSSADQPPLRDDETQQTTSLLLQPYPQAFVGEAQTVLYVNTAANYRYLAQLVVTFDEAGDVIEIGEGSGLYATDLAGVARLFDDVETIDDVIARANPDLVEVVGRIGARVRELDGTIFGQTEVFLEGRRDFVRTQETNLGNLSQDANLWYANQYLEALRAAPSAPGTLPETILISFGNGGGIRNFIGENIVPGGGGEVVQGPPAANPDVGKQEGDVSALDISDSLRFNNDLVFGEVTAANLLRLVEHGVSAARDGFGLAQAGGFGQWAGVRFAFDAFRPAGDRVVSLEVLAADGSVLDTVVRDGELQGDAGRRFGITTTAFTANGGDRYPVVIENRTNLLDIVDTVRPETLTRDELAAGRVQDALGEFLHAFHNEAEGGVAFDAAETPASEDRRIVQLAFEFTPIYDLQGAGQVSPYVLETVGALSASGFFRAVRNGVDFPNGQPTRNIDASGNNRLNNINGPEVTTLGIVTAIVGQSFYLQDATGDGDIATSDAILVFAGRNLPAGLAVGDEVRVTGLLQERFTNTATSPNAGTASRERPVTQISVGSAEAIQTVSTGNALPEAVVIGSSGRTPPDRNIEDDRFVVFNPETSGLDFWESLEGMRIAIEDAMAVTGLTRNDNFWVVANRGAESTGLSPRNTLTISDGDFNPESLRVQLPNRTGAPQISAGDRFGDLTGVLGFGFGQDQLVALEDPFANYASAGLEEPITALRGDAHTLTVATYNVFNLDPNDADIDRDVADFRFLTIARHIVENLGTADVVALQEVQDNSGQANDGVTAADETLRQLVRAIDFVDDGRINGSLVYDFVDTPDVQNNRGGGQPGGNIRNAFIFNTARVQLVEGSVSTIGSQDAGQPNFASRLPLVADFAFNGEVVTLVNVHNSAKTGSAPLLGIDQPFDARLEDPSINARVDQRAEQMALVGDFVQRALRDDPDARIVALGDFNEFQFVSPVAGLKGAGLNDLGDLLPAEERYTFNFNGNAQQIDHILVTDALAEGARVDIVNVNTDLFDNVNRVVLPDGRSSTLNDFRGSDHDPVLAALRVGEPADRGTEVVLIAGATVLPDLVMNVEVLINGVSFGRLHFEQASAITAPNKQGFRDAAVRERFVFDTDFAEIETVEVVFRQDRWTGPGGFDRNVFVDGVLIDGERFDADAFAFYDRANSVNGDGPGGDMFWAGRTTFSGFDANVLV